MTKSTRIFSIAMLLDGKGGGRELSDEEVADWSADDGLLWLDLNLNNRRGREWLVRQSQLDASVSSILLTEETRPRSLEENDGLIVIMRGINMNPGSLPDDMVAVRMLLQNGRIITSRRRKVLSIRDIRADLLAGKGPQTTGRFLVTMTGKLGGRIQAAVENIETLLEDLGDRVSGGDLESLRAELGVVRRQAAAIRRHLAPQRDALDRLTRTLTGPFSEIEVFDLREEGNHLTRYIEDLDLARENALVTQEELMNQIAQQQNARMYLLSVVAAIFLPLTFVTGMLGMNVAGLPGTEDPDSFYVSSAVMVALGVGLVVLFKWKKWI